ncbi:MAG: hypothetical protein QOI57_2986 [Rubrobacteraceae bacterium]|jgi:hypothetical protein|nr:hypothetical protein [Rubrobacteraceae bacterium]
MITTQDAELHAPESDDPTWAETNYFGFYVPELHLNGGVYALFRTNLGVVNTTVSLNSRKVEAPWQAEHWESQVHVPIPDNRSLLDYQLANGLSVRCREPNKLWDVDYDDGDGTEIHFRYTALMEPFDIHDPEQDPMVAAEREGSDFAWGTAYNGHFDQTGHIEGEIVLNGARHALDCVSTMDHSWGPRPERAHTPMSWLHAHFSRDLAIHAIFTYDPDVAPDGTSALQLTHGYVLEDGEVHGLKAGEGESTRSGMFPMTTRLRVVDRRDREWVLDGSAKTTFPWQAWPGVVAFNVLHEWRCEDRTGFGEVMDFLGLGQITAIYNGRAA